MLFSPENRAGGTLDDLACEFFFLDDPANPLSLKYSHGENRLQVVRIGFPGDAMAAASGAPTIANGKTECIYKPASGISPYVEFSVDWGGGEAAMTAMGMMGRIEPGLANPYDELGDQAAGVGPMLMIRTGEDLVTIVFTGVSDAPAKAKQIFDTAKGRW